MKLDFSFLSFSPFGPFCVSLFNRKRHRDPDQHFRHQLRSRVWHWNGELDVDSKVVYRWQGGWRISTWRMKGDPNGFLSHFGLFKLTNIKIGISNFCSLHTWIWIDGEKKTHCFEKLVLLKSSPRSLVQKWRQTVQMLPAHSSVLGSDSSLLIIRSLFFIPFLPWSIWFYLGSQMH